MKAKQRKRQKPKYLVFLSHSSRDIWLSDAIARRLRAKGIGVWLDEMSLEGGDDVSDSIVNNIKTCDEIIVLVSPESVKSQWVAAEIGMAKVLKKRITGLLVHTDLNAIAPLTGIKSYELNLFEKLLLEIVKRRGSK
jgi:hypothetical protein